MLCWADALHESLPASILSGLLGEIGHLAEWSAVELDRAESFHRHTFLGLWQLTANSRNQPGALHPERPRSLGFNHGCTLDQVEKTQSPLMVHPLTSPKSLISFNYCYPAGYPLLHHLTYPNPEKPTAMRRTEQNAATARGALSGFLGFAGLWHILAFGDIGATHSGSEAKPLSPTGRPPCRAICPSCPKSELYTKSTPSSCTGQSFSPSCSVVTDQLVRCLKTQFARCYCCNTCLVRLKSPSSGKDVDVRDLSLCWQTLNPKPPALCECESRNPNPKP